jgi:ADP-L-glycero-D-manno-heptose 6-epimerase
MIVVTGAAGFIGSNLIHELNAEGETNILAVDDLTLRSYETGQKFLNLSGAKFVDYMDMHVFRDALQAGNLDKFKLRAILHQGACSNTLIDDGRYMMENNHGYSKALLHYAVVHRVPFVYASTAAVYGLSEKFTEAEENEKPLNVYGFSKLVFDNYVRHLLPQIQSTVVGLRYFKVYGPREQHKGRMASVIHHFSEQLRQYGLIKMFEGSGGYGDGEQRRDFVYVRDLARMNIFFSGTGNQATIKQPVQAVVNAGTGQSRSFNDVANTLIHLHGSGRIEYIPFPEDLKSRYQHYTQADISQLRQAGYLAESTDLDEGIRETLASK